MNRNSIVLLPFALLLAGCSLWSQNSANVVMKESRFTAMRDGGNSFTTEFRGYDNGSVDAALYGSMFWNARLAVRTGARYFVVDHQSVSAHGGLFSTTQGTPEAVGGGGIPPAAPRAVVSPSGGYGVGDAGSLPAAKRARPSAPGAGSYRVEATVRTFAEQPQDPRAVDAARFLTEARDPAIVARLP